MAILNETDTKGSRKRKFNDASSEGNVNKKTKSEKKLSADSKKKKSKKGNAIKDFPAVGKSKDHASKKNVGDDKSSKPKKGGMEKPSKMKKGGFLKPGSKKGKDPAEKFDHAKKKEIRLARRKSKKDETIFEVGLKSKKLWEGFRPEDCPEVKRNELINDLIALIKGKVVKLCLAHDTVRVIESLLLHGSVAQRNVVFKEIMDSNSVVDMSKSKYGSFIVIKMLKYGSKEQREGIGRLYDGKTAKLMKHKIANAVVELYYNDHANAIRRNRMLQDFCGPEFTKFKDEEIRTVKDLITKYPEKERDIYKNLHENVCTLITKGCYNHSLVHTVIYNFLTIAKEKERSEVITQLRDACIHIMHSSDGSKASMLSIWYGNNKDRKTIMKSFKTFVLKIATEEHGHMVLMAIFDSMDDTVFVGKSIFTEIIANLAEIAADKYGRKVLSYILAPRSTVLFHPQVLDKLKIGDGNPYSKKDSEIRRNELRKEISPSLVKYLANNVGELLSNGDTIFIVTILNNALGDLTESMKDLSLAITKDNELIENTANHQMLKKIIQADKSRFENGDTALFSKILLETASIDNIDAWLRCNRGGFLLVNILETEIPEVKSLLEEKLKALKPTLSTQKSVGVECLKKKLGF